MHQPGMSELPSPDILQELLIVFRISTDRDPSQLLKELLHVTFHKQIVQVHLCPACSPPLSLSLIFM